MVVVSCYVSVAILKIIKRLLRYVYFAPLPYATEVDDADNDKNVYQQNILSFSVNGVIRKLTTPRVDHSASWPYHNVTSPRAE